MIPYIPPSMMDPERLSAAGLGSEAEMLARLLGTNAVFGGQQPAAQPAQAAPQQAPAQMAQMQPQGGGGGFLDGIRNFLDGGQGQKVNQTVNWLQQQGLDAGTSQALARNPALLQDFLKQKMDPLAPLQQEKLGLEIDQMRNPRMAPGEEARLGLDRERFDFERSNADRTQDIKEYQQAKREGYQGDFRTWVLETKRAGATNVDARNMGSIPPGYRVEYDEQGNPVQMSPIPGGPAAMEQQAADEAAANRQRGAMERSGIVTQDIDRILGRMDSGVLPDVGIGAWLSSIPGTDARDISALLDTVKANIGFEELNRMRQQSPTGGALGNVTERELAFLQSVAGSLDQSQSPQQLRDNLNRLWNAYMDTIHGEGNFEPRRIGSAANKPMSEMTDEELEAIANGNR